MSAVESGRFAYQWSDYRTRRRWLLATLLAYPPLGFAIGYSLKDLAPPLPAIAAIVLLLAWPAAIFAFAGRLTAWPCPQCGKSFSYLPAGSKANVFTVPACGHCGLPKWAHTGGTVPQPGTPLRVIELMDPARQRQACWFCGRVAARGPAVDVYAASTSGEGLQLLIPRCRACATVHRLDEGLGAAAFGLVGAVLVGWLFIRGVDERAGFVAALGRAVPFGALWLVVVTLFAVAGQLLSRPSLWVWHSRPLADWTEHPDVKRYRDIGWDMWRTEREPMDVSTTG